MSDELWQRAQDVFDAAAAKSPAEREPYLHQACDGNPDLLAEVRSLLAHDARAAGDFLEPPQLLSTLREPPAAAGPDPLLGCRVGAFTVTPVIDAGGMGTVYEAVQDEPRRTVALKVMNRCQPSHAALRRFQFEAQVLARLRHPHIAQVYAAGMHDDGQRRMPYFALEFVANARPLTIYAGEHGLDVRARLELFAKVCDAVHHGHQKGIIHRDLKPGNILVDAGGEPKVIDFGVARATDVDLAVTTQHTLAGQIVGTVQYMSPEQCDADPHDLDTRSDVYALGVVLYELLAGAPPYDTTGTSIYQATRLIKEQPPQRLALHNPRLRGDLEIVVATALAKAREQRYQSAADLAQDLRRYLAGEPIDARSPTLWMRAVHWAARHPLLVTTAACLGIAALVVAATFMVVQIVNARPHRLVMLREPGLRHFPQGYEARLEAPNGRLLRAWTSQDAQGIALGEMLRWPQTPRGGRLAVIVNGPPLVTGELGGVWAYDVDRSLDEEEWVRRVNPDDPVPDPHGRGYTAAEFSPCFAKLVDVFAEDPGPEILVNFSSRLSQAIVRIYNLRGDLLYEFWSDGSINSCHWMEEARLLVFGGIDAVVYWEDRGYEVDQDGRQHPPVVYVLKPERNKVYHGFVQPEWGAGGPQPLWYKCLGPSQIVSGPPVEFWARVDPPRTPNGRRFRVHAETGRPSIAVGWDVDEHGEEIPGTRGAVDTYNRKRALPEGHPDKLPLPPIDVFRLEPLQPVRAPLRPTTRPVSPPPETP